MSVLVKKLKEKVLNGGLINYEEALQLFSVNDIESLQLASNQIREEFLGNKVSLCQAMNAQSGSCPENCKYCSQSSHYKTGIKNFDLVSEKEVMDFAEKAMKDGVKCVALSTSGNILADKDLDKLLKLYRVLKSNTDLTLCGAHGLITIEEGLMLKDAGLTIYQHNLQTSSKNYKNVCDTHTYAQRFETLLNAKKAGLDICAGGIIGLGESVSDRIEMALDLRKLNVKKSPFNILNPIPGTPLGDKELGLTKSDVLKTISIFRFIMPDTTLIYGAGRIFLEDDQHLALRHGINGIVVGNFLTTPGKSMESDIDMLKSEGFNIL